MLAPTASRWGCRGCDARAYTLGDFLWPAGSRLSSDAISFTPSCRDVGNLPHHTHAHECVIGRVLCPLNGETGQRWGQTYIS